MLTASVQQYILSLLQSALGTSISSIRLAPVGGGSINHCFQISANTGQHFFVKVNHVAELPGLFMRENEGLALLASKSVIRTPAVIAFGENENFQVLVLEWINQGLKSQKFWKLFGEQLALLHTSEDAAEYTNFASTGRQFGLSTDNYMGALPQRNSPLDDWGKFFIERRLRPQLQLAMDRRLIDGWVADRFERLFLQLPAIFEPKSKPVLVHGDLWSGNFLCDERERPVLVDPAAYYGHPCVDLAMTTLFGGFETIFYDSYCHILPFAANYREQWAIVNLYPLLIHLNLFGKGYLPDILHTIDRY